MQTSKVIIQTSEGEYICTFEEDLSRREAKQLAEKLNNCFAELKLKRLMEFGTIATAEIPL